MAAADKLRNHMDGNEERKKRIRLLGLNLGIAASIITFSPGLIGLKLDGASPLEAALSGTIIVLSIAGIIYGNLKIIGPEKVIPPPEWTLEYCIEALNNHRGLKTFEEAIDLLLIQIERLQKNNKTIRDILLQIFSDSEISYQKFDSAIADVQKIFVKNISSINN